MKILIIQLARLGDIFMTWPSVRAIRRLHPQAEIHFLTRKKFLPALDGLTELAEIHVLPTQEIVAPLFTPQIDVKTSHQLLSGFCDNLKAENFDWIVNFTFSPVSSYLTHALTTPVTRISGYTRQSDGFLSIPDDMSAYFYAQVGVHRSNRYHLCEIFGTMIGADLIPFDFAPPAFIQNTNLGAEIVIHIGASESHKSLSAEKWTNIINQYLKQSSDNIVLIGATAEVATSNSIMSSVPADRVKSLVGQTQIKELFSILSAAKVLVGCDSAPMHIASLTGTPCLNLSLKGVNFWETGPRSLGSLVLKLDTETDLSGEEIASILVKMRRNEKQEVNVIKAISGTPSYWALATGEADFQWNLIKALYTGEAFPAPKREEFYQGIQKLREINQLMIEQMQAFVTSKEPQIAAGIIDRGEEIIQTIGKIVPSLAIIIRWYQTEKVRIGPGSQAETLRRTLEIHQTLAKICELYHEYALEYGAASSKESP